MTDERIFVGGLVEGVNYPKGRDKENPIINLEGCKDIIIVDRKYFLQYQKLIESWALEYERTLTKAAI